MYIYRCVCGDHIIKFKSRITYLHIQHVSHQTSIIYCQVTKVIIHCDMTCFLIHVYVNNLFQLKQARPWNSNPS